jgi:flagellar biosynthesis protein
MNAQHYFNQKNRRQMNGPSAAVIRYDESGDGSPTIVAQGKGLLASKIMELAKQHNIQLQEDEGLVQNLLDIDLGDNVPPQLYSVIAEILLLIEEMEKNY